MSASPLHSELLHPVEGDRSCSGGEQDQSLSSTGLLNGITAVILAGGAGTRLRSVVADRPKVLAEVDGKPFLAFLLDQLAGQGIGRAVLCTGYLGEQIRAYFGSAYRGVELEYSHELTPLGTGGALIQALPQVRSEDVLVLNGDSFCGADFGASLRFHRRTKAAATVILAHVAQVSRYGQVTLSPDGRITRFCEKGAATGAGWINSGIYWFARSVLLGFPLGQVLSLEREVLARLVGRDLYGFQNSGPFLDIGIPDDYARAAQFLREAAFTATPQSS